MNTSINSLLLDVTEVTQVGEVRRGAVGLATRLQYDETACGRVAIVATELANNLVHHAQHGRMILQAKQCRGVEGVVLLALDRGPGIRDIQQSKTDGYSTAGTPGRGLGAVYRLCSTVDIYTQEGVGTVIAARVDQAALPTADGLRYEVGAVNVPYPGETECGDAWALAEDSQSISVLVADGLGHGPLAAEAAQLAVSIFREHSHLSPDEQLQLMNSALRGTRGAAIAIARLLPEQNQLQYVGVGNIAALILAPQGNRNLVSLNGTVGGQMRRVQTFVYPWSRQSQLVMFSDGLNTHVRPDPYPGLLQRNPTTIAAVLFRDFNRGRDDATVVIMRQRPEEPNEHAAAG